MLDELFLIVAGAGATAAVAGLATVVERLYMRRLVKAEFTDRKQSKARMEVVINPDDLRKMAAQLQVMRTSISSMERSITEDLETAVPVATKKKAK